MEETREISALFHLIDDPDDEVFSKVSERIVSFGRPIIPNLEHLWETSPDEIIQERVEILIHRLHLHELTDEFMMWKRYPEFDLLNGAMLVSKFQYPDLNVSTVTQEIEKMRRNIWLELNSYLTPLEQVNVFTTILYNYYNLKGTEVSYSEPNDFLLNKVLEVKRGNGISNGVLYLILSQMLDIPVRAINIPRQFILAYFDVNPGEWSILPSNPAQKIQFFIDPTSGQVFTHKDVETYFKRISVPPTASYFRPMNNIRIVQFLLEEYSKCFEDDKNRYRQDELLRLAALLDKNAE